LEEQPGLNQAAFLIFSYSGSPFADETYLNVGMLNARIAAMQNKINELETALKGKKN
jgi:hypothetical protein